LKYKNKIHSSHRDDPINFEFLSALFNETRRRYYRMLYDSNFMLTLLYAYAVLSMLLLR
jgi:hypothetical protein